MPAAHSRPEDLPGVIPVFPLDGVLLLPLGGLPLNIFEPRYLNMIDDAMSGERMIGMVQTRPGGDRERPNLAAVGCAGRITSFSETSDGRYLVTLTGVCRFAVEAELSARTPYRQVRASYARFAGDLDRGGVVGEGFDKPRFLRALKAYLGRRDLEVDWKQVEDAPAEALVTSLSMALPFDPAEKQALLEADTPTDRGAALLAMIEIDTGGLEDDAPRAMH